VLSIQKGEFDHANSWLPNAEQTEAVREDLTYDASLSEHAEDSHPHSSAPVRG
jgi:hypothetical protein